MKDFFKIKDERLKRRESRMQESGKAFIRKSASSLSTIMKQREKIKEKMVSLLQPEVEFAYIFGSLVSGRMRPSSDLDIAVYLPCASVTLQHKMAFINRLSAAFSREVDVVFLNDADIIITMQILANGELLINNNPGELALFRAKSAGIYADFKLSRRIIEQNLLSGGIYA
jgi:predicted nucleotidyltransferase